MAIFLNINWYDQRTQAHNCLALSILTDSQNTLKIYVEKLNVQFFIYS